MRSSLLLFVVLSSVLAACGPDGGGSGGGGSSVDGGACAPIATGTYPRMVLSEATPPGCPPPVVLPSYPLTVLYGDGSSPVAYYEGAYGYTCHTEHNGCAIETLCQGILDSGYSFSLVAAYQFEGATMTGIETWTTDATIPACATKATTIGLTR